MSKSVLKREFELNNNPHLSMSFQDDTQGINGLSGFGASNSQNSQSKFMSAMQ